MTDRHPSKGCLINRTTYRRSGAVYVILVVALLLVVLGASAAMLRGEVASQRNSASQMKSDTLLRAITAAKNLQFDRTNEIVLPIDSDQKIVITANADKTQLTAKWLRRDKLQQSITRSMKLQSDDSESESEDEL
ncbi:hypothetical protein [Planctomycetes bacterium K23_9]|uniref:Uncharacterized protein n=1 Tax=Stieleria marina TaxID=1930275 RepID=A0A517NY44_9BACT|nr:hypothetical protein K239x_40560 [Planctomycetes bacterium K23_9]